MAPKIWPALCLRGSPSFDELPTVHETLIISDPAIMLGRPVVVGTRVTVDEILDCLADGQSADQIAASRPGLTAAGIQAALRFGADTVRAATPIAQTPPLELHGPHVVTLSDQASGTARRAIAVRAYFPEAEAAAVRRPPREGAPAALYPMDRIHPAGVFEALFPDESEPFPYRLVETRAGGQTREADDPYGLPPFLAPEDLRSIAAALQLDGHPEGAAPHLRKLQQKLGAHRVEHAGLSGVTFVVWAPNAESVSAIGDFNQWNDLCSPLRPVPDTGLWELFVPGIGPGERYKYRIKPRDGGAAQDKADPFGLAAELRPGTASVVWDPGRYRWHDAGWLEQRGRRQALDAPLSIYEVHLGSWRRAPADGGGQAPRWLTYGELADQLVPYAKEMGYTHIEPMPVAEHPFDGSWGYQITGFFAPTSRHGTPDDFRRFVDAAHEAGLGVILDWVPGHFPKDAHGLSQFDGTPLFEHADPRRSENLEWGTSAFNLERPEVRAFLLANALYWLEEFHLDGLRVDAVSSMIYLDYSRRHWLPNQHGGRENLEAAAFLRQLNALVHREHPDVLTIAEESTAWPRITGADAADSLGFDLKWNLGWMHDTLGYAQQDPVFRRHHHNQLTFSLLYAFSEQFLLPFSHDEVVHGKRSMLSKMPGDEWQQFANLRALYGYMFAHPGKKLQFMGCELGPTSEWNHDCELDWSLLDRDRHHRLQGFVRDLNRLYAGQPALHERDFGWDGFQWIDCDDAERSVLSFIRRGRAGSNPVIAVANFTPVPRPGYRLGVPAAGTYRILLNSDDAGYGGSGLVDRQPLTSEANPVAGQPHSVVFTLPPLAMVLLAADPAASGVAALAPRARRQRQRRPR